MNARGPIDSDKALTDKGHGATLLLYDWFKHMTTLSVVTLGGMIGILQALKDPPPAFALGVVVLAVAASGMFGFDAMNKLVEAEVEDRPVPRILTFHRKGATLTYGMGLGAFLYLAVAGLG